MNSLSMARRFQVIVVAKGILEVPNQIPHDLEVTSGWVAHPTGQLLDDESNLDELLGQVDATSSQ